jgi:protein TonB
MLRPVDHNLDLSFYPLRPTAAGWVMVSAVLHAALLIGLLHAGRWVVQTQAPIRVTLIEPAPPPPPRGGTVAAATRAAPVEPAPVPQSPPQPVSEPRPLKIAKKPPPKPQRDLPAPPAQPAAPPVEPGERPGSPAGDDGGVIGGVAGGKVGGMLGGRGDRVFRADEVAAAPVVLSQTMPVYPPVARARGIEGLVVLESVIDRAGRVEPDSLTVVQSVPALDTAAMTALRQWRFRSGRDARGEPVRVVVQVPIRFRLR